MLLREVYRQHDVGWRNAVFSQIALMPHPLGGPLPQRRIAIGRGIHFDIVQTAAVGIGLFLPPMGVGLLMALRFAGIPVGQHARAYWPYVVALLTGLMLIICLPELTLAIPRSAAFVR